MRWIERHMTFTPPHQQIFIKFQNLLIFFLLVRRPVCGLNSPVKWVTSLMLEFVFEVKMEKRDSQSSSLVLNRDLFIICTTYTEHIVQCIKKNCFFILSVSDFKFVQWVYTLFVQVTQLAQLKYWKLGWSNFCKKLLDTCHVAL